MKVVIDERVKHRLTGVVVILSIAVIFLPAMMKKSNQHFEDSMTVSLALPTKPTPPAVAIPNQTELFQSVKVAHVDIKAIPTEPVATKTVSLSTPISIPTIIETPQSSPVTPTAIVAEVSTPVKAVVKPVMERKKIATLIAPKAQTQKEGYAVQLASFTQKRNAEYLVSRLRHQGYTATYNVLNNKEGDVFKVIVGSLHQKEAAIHLQKQLAANMQLKGFVVKTGVS